MSKYKLSAILVTRNEEKKIRRCLESIRWADEIVVVDQSSDDNTVTICKEYTDKVFVVSPKGFCEPDRPVALSKTINVWVLYLDADEEVPFGLKKEITELLSKEPDFNCYYISYKTFFLNKWIRGSGWYPGYTLRLFKKGAVKFSCDIHTAVIPVGAYGYLTQSIKHYTCEDLEEYIRKMNRYTNTLAQQAFKRGVRLSPFNSVLKLFLLPTAYAFKKFVFQKGFIDGVYGILIACLTWLVIFLMYAKTWEMQPQKIKPT